MHTVYQVDAKWERETGRWTALSDDIPGLVVEAGSFRELQELIAELAPQMFALNTPDLKGPFPININVHQALIADMPQAAE